MKLMLYLGAFKTIQPKSGFLQLQACTIIQTNW